MERLTELVFHYILPMIPVSVMKEVQRPPRSPDTHRVGESSHNCHLHLPLLRSDGAGDPPRPGLGREVSIYTLCFGITVIVNSSLEVQPLQRFNFIPPPSPPLSSPTSPPPLLSSPHLRRPRERTDECMCHIQRRHIVQVHTTA